MIDDPGQLPSVAGELVYHSKPSNAIGEQGYQTYRMFDTVIKPTINQRVQDDCIKQEKIRNLSLRFRKGESNLDEWKWLLTRDPSNVTNLIMLLDSFIAITKLQPILRSSSLNCNNLLSHKCSSFIYCCKKHDC